MRREVVEATVVTHGLRLFVRQRGDGHPLLLINGLGAHCDLWGEAERVLGRTSHTIVFDCPGTGRSDMPLLPLSIPTLAQMVCRILDALGHDRADVLGYSFGGAVAQQLACDAPDRIRRLALVSTWCGWGGDPGTPAAMLRAILKLNRIASPLAYSYQLCSLGAWSSLRWLERIETPTLLLSGAEDDLVPPANAVRIARLLPNSSLHLVPGVGHLIMFDTESAGAQLLAEFFSAPSLDHSTAWNTGLIAAA